MEAATRRSAEAPAARPASPAPQPRVSAATPLPAPATPRERAAGPGGVGLADVLALQRAVGNRNVARLVGRPQEPSPPAALRAGGVIADRTIRRASVTLEHTVPAPPRVRQAIEAAGPWLEATLDRVNAWVLAELEGRPLPQEADQLFQFIARGDLFFFAQDLSRILVQWSVVRRNGEVKIPAGYQAGMEVPVKGFRYVDEGDHPHADSMGEGDDALLTFYPVDAAATDEKLTMTVVHELSHATPGLRTEDVAYQSEDLFRYLHLYAAPGLGANKGPKSAARANADSFAYASAAAQGKAPAAEAIRDRQGAPPVAITESAITSAQPSKDQRTHMEAGIALARAVARAARAAITDEIEPYLEDVKAKKDWWKAKKGASYVLTDLWEAVKSMPPFPPPIAPRYHEPTVDEIARLLAATKKCALAVTRAGLPEHGGLHYLPLGNYVARPKTSGGLNVGKGFFNQEQPGPFMLDAVAAAGFEDPLAEVTPPLFLAVVFHLARERGKLPTSLPPLGTPP